MLLSRSIDFIKAEHAQNVCNTHGKSFLSNENGEISY